MHRLQELVRLHRMGTGAREVARLLGMSPNTEREYRRALGLAALLEGPVDVLPELAVLRETCGGCRGAVAPSWPALPPCGRLLVVSKTRIVPISYL
jgi:hypothetical protein